MRRIQWLVIDMTPMIKLLPILVAKVLPRIELLPGLLLQLALFKKQSQLMMYQVFSVECII